MGSDSHENALQRESHHALEWGDQGQASSSQGRAWGSQEGERFGVRPLAAEHQLLMASRNTSQVFGVSESLCLASRHLPSDSGVKAGSAGEKNTPRALKSLSRA